MGDDAANADIVRGCLTKSSTILLTPVRVNKRFAVRIALCNRSLLRMPICITCSTPVRNLYTTYSRADDRSLGKGVRLTQCPNCKRFADKYVEHDFVVLFIDLVLIKPQVSLLSTR